MIEGTDSRIWESVTLQTMRGFRSAKIRMCVNKQEFEIKFYHLKCRKREASGPVQLLKREAAVCFHANHYGYER